ncbi:MAG: hypothetical protein QOD42_1408 [Sphingomonadales bacterium]|jgi:hypothetical protein|nr:hypothetical protein [Sphingomonadales bacterium]
MVKWLPKADTRADAVLRWSGIYTLMTGAYTWLAGLLPWFGPLSLAEKIAIAIPAALVTSLAVTSSLALYRYFRPLSRPSPTPGEAADAVVTALGETVSSNYRKARERLDKLETQYAKVINDYQRMTGLEVRFTDALDKLKEAIQAKDKVFEDRHFIDERNLTELRDATAKSTAQLYLALQAIRARETERFYADIVEEEGTALQAKVRDNEPFQGDDWADWEAGQLRLEGAMGHWLEVADGWQPKVREWINDVPSDSLTSSGWGDIDDLFQKHGQVIKYKTQIAKFNNWKRLRNHVSSAIYMAAFGGPHADEILETIPGGGPTVERVKEKPNGQQGE